MVTRASVALSMTPVLISCFWRSLLELAHQLFQEAGGGAGNEVSQPAPETRSARAGRQELAVQDEVELFRVQIRQEVHRQVGGEIGFGAEQDDVHRRVAFQGEGQHGLPAEEFLPVHDDGDADGLGGVVMVSNQQLAVSR